MQECESQPVIINWGKIWYYRASFGLPMNHYAPPNLWIATTNDYVILFDEIDENTHKIVDKIKKTDLVDLSIWVHASLAAYGGYKIDTTFPVPVGTLADIAA